MYEEYYGFQHPPFSLTPDPRFLYRSHSHDEALQQVLQAIARKEGFIVLTGDIGTGKTTLSRTLLAEFDRTTFTALILNPFLSVEDLLREVLVGYGVAGRDSLKSGRLAVATRGELVRTLHEFLLTLAPIHGSAVLIIDEAQHLAPEVLEEIRLLSNLETDTRKLLQIILVGQLNLLELLRDARLRQLDQRISIRCLLSPLTRAELEAYVAHRLQVAEPRAHVGFTREALDRLQAASAGVPRVINLICDRALMFGAQARSRTITEELVTRAEAALGLASAPPAVATPEVAPVAVTAPPARRLVRSALFLLALAVAATVAYVYAFGTGGGVSDEPPPAIAAPAAESLGALAPAARPLPNDSVSLAPPPLSDGALTILIDTYEDPVDAAAAERELRRQDLPVYAIDLGFPDGVRRRLLFVGRFRSRTQADATRDALVQQFPTARIVLSSTEPSARE